MKFRTIVIKKTSKLQYIQGYLVIYDGENELKVFLNEISLLLIEAKNSMVTVPLLIELVRNNVVVILCDEKHNPSASLLGFNNHYSVSGNIFKQLKWKNEIASYLWQHIIKLKILLQKQALLMYSLTTKIHLLDDYIDNVNDFDNSNREGLAAKVYFNEFFGSDFVRTAKVPLNGYLDYGYSILLSCFNREIVSCGYLTQIGIFHRGKTNPFNLSSDFMEPFRVLVDIIVKASLNDDKPLVRIRKLLSHKIIMNSEERYLDDAIGVFVVQLIRFLNEESHELPHIQLKSLEHYTNDKSNETNSNV